jgi:hypothetical protein
MKNPSKRGIKRMLPLGRLPLWGREGGTLLTAAEIKRISQKRGFQQSPQYPTSNPVSLILTDPDMKF